MRFAAVDLGASGGRVMVGVVEDGRVVGLEEAHRFPHGVVERDGHLRWDAERLLGEVERGLERVGEVASIGIDTWGVDYGLLDDDGLLVADPIAYRDDRTAKVVDDVHAVVSPAELYEITGVQHLPFNTIYQLAAEQRSRSWALRTPPGPEFSVPSPRTRRRRREVTAASIASPPAATSRMARTSSWPLISFRR